MDSCLIFAQALSFRETRGHGREVAQDRTSRSWTGPFPLDLLQIVNLAFSGCIALRMPQVAQLNGVP